MFPRIQPGAFPSSYRAVKRRRLGSTGAFHEILFCQCGYIFTEQCKFFIGSSALHSAMMVMAARDRPSAAESDFLCRHTHSSCQYAGADCDPTPSQM